MRCLKRCPSMQDPAQAKISMLSYEMVSKECLTNGNSKLIYHFNEIRDFKMHVEIAFLNLDPSWHQTDLRTLILKLLS